MTDPIDKLFGKSIEEVRKDAAASSCYGLAMREIYGESGIASRLRRPFLSTWKDTVSQREFNVGVPFEIATSDGNPMTLVFASPAYGPPSEERKLSLRACEPSSEMLGQKIGEFFLRETDTQSLELDGFIPTADNTFSMTTDEQTAVLKTISEIYKERGRQVDQENQRREISRQERREARNKRKAELLSKGSVIKVVRGLMLTAVAVGMSAAVVGGVYYSYQLDDDHTEEFDDQNIELPEESYAPSPNTNEEWVPVLPLHETGLSSQEQKAIEQNAPEFSRTDHNYRITKVLHAIEAPDKAALDVALESPSDETLISVNPRLIEDNAISRFTLEPAAGNCVSFVSLGAAETGDMTSNLKVVASNQSPDGFTVKTKALDNVRRIDSSGNLLQLYAEGQKVPEKFLGTDFTEKDAQDVAAEATTVCRTTYSQAQFFVSYSP